MKIAFVYDVPYPWHIGGIEAMNYNEAEELAKHNEVHFFTTLWEGMPGSSFTRNGIHYHAIHRTGQASIYRHGRRSIREAVAYSASLKGLYDYKFDAVITNAFPVLHLGFLKRYCKAKGSKLIIEVAEVWDRDYWRSYIGPVAGDMAYAYSKSAIRGADSYIAISSTTATALENIGIKREKIRIFAPCMDDALIAKAKNGVAKRSKTVLFSGRLIKEKGLDKWIDVVKKAHLIDSSVKGLIIGSGPEKRHIDKLIAESGMGDVISVRRFYPDAKSLYRKIRCSALLLHMSTREGLGIIAIESVALGTPVLLPSYTPIPKEVADMCTVREENSIPKAIVNIARSNKPARYIHNLKNLGIYSKSNISGFYRKLLNAS